ncbi:hypothetical protein [Halomonas nitroreducens]|uniref:Phytanoyl-CoA dioxygenase n=1 Tax=Halomonas nitroreducens TaxID=447425 RepID=A0A431V509_9GAMM|nr:hypothetical protein [Halomonas nitroreducens]RTR05357.1 hypothetical protein EKG36_07165 [Halomonas nitroreducens]
MIGLRRMGGYFIGLNVRRLKRVAFIMSGHRDYRTRRYFPLDLGLAPSVDRIMDFRNFGYMPVDLGPALTSELIAASERKIGEIGVEGTVPINGTRFFRDALQQSDYDPGSPFMRFALDESILNTVGQYLDSAPLIASIELIYSMPSGVSEDDRSKSQWFHRDHIGKKIAKLFVYIRDVERQNGPLRFIPLEASKKVPWWQQIPHHIPDEIMGKYVDEGELVEYCGEAGSAVFVDTDRLFHCGSRCSEPRLAFIVNYTTGFNYRGRCISKLWLPENTSEHRLSRLQRLALGQPS